MVSACVKISSARARKSLTRARSLRFGICAAPQSHTLGAYYHKLGRVASPASLFWTSYGLILVAAVRRAVFMLAIDEIGKRHVDAGKR